MVFTTNISSLSLSSRFDDTVTLFVLESPVTCQGSRIVLKEPIKAPESHRPSAIWPLAGADLPEHRRTGGTHDVTSIHRHSHPPRNRRDVGTQNRMKWSDPILCADILPSHDMFSPLLYSRSRQPQSSTDQPTGSHNKKLGMLRRCKGWLYLTRSYVAEPGYRSPDVRA